MNKKLMLIINPAAGRGGCKLNLPDALHLLDQGGFRTTLFFTAGRGDATRFAAEHGGEYDTVACVGGDGTLSEVLAGLMRLENPPQLGYIPMGTANDVATTLDLPKNDTVGAARRILEGTPHPFDVGGFGEDGFFAYIAAFGAFTEVSYATPQNQKKALGHLAYILEGMKDIPQIKPLPVRVETDDRVLEGEYIFGAVSNSTSLGGVLSLDPELVDMADGIFEIFLVKPPSSAAALANALRDLRAMHYDDPMIDFVKTSRAVVYAQPDMDWSLDGERQPGTERAVIENLHGAIRLMVNE